MAATEYHCISCGATFVSKFFQYECRMCVQTKAISNQTEQMRKAQVEQKNRYNEAQKLQREQDYAIQREEIKRTNEIHNYISNVRNQVANLQHSLNLYKENQNVSIEDAYHFGLNYIDEFYEQGNNTLNLKVWVNSNGLLSWNWNGNPYLNSNLNESFMKGLQDDMNQRIVDKEYLKELAYNSGYSLMPKFYFQSDENICDVSNCQSVEFVSNVVSKLNKETGEIDYNWDHPFTDDELNDAYSNGVNDRCFEENSEEKKETRLNDIMKEKKLLNYEKNVNSILLAIVFSSIGFGFLVYTGILQNILNKIL